MSTKISINNTQNLTSSTTNSNNNIDSVSSGGTFTLPSRRTVLLLASDLTLAVTSNGEGTSATLSTFSGSENQIFLTNFDLFENSFIISSVDNQLFLGPLTNTDIAPVGFMRSLDTPLPGPPSDPGDNGGGDLPPNPSIPWMKIKPAQPMNNGFALSLPISNSKLSLINQCVGSCDCLPLFLTKDELEFLIVFLP